MQEAVKEAFKGIKKGEGGPFGAVIVLDGKVIAKAHNTVVKDNDPTAHAEVNAIRKASKKLKTYCLKGCELITTCEPCPLCLAAIKWAGIKKATYGCSRKDAGKLGFSDARMYEEFEGKREQNTLLICSEREKCTPLFDCWDKMKNKKKY